MGVNKCWQEAVDISLLQIEVVDIREKKCFCAFQQGLRKVPTMEFFPKTFDFINGTASRSIFVVVSLSGKNITILSVSQNLPVFQYSLFATSQTTIQSHNYNY